MNRFPIPALSLLNSPLALAGSRRPAEGTASMGGAAGSVRATYAWGPDCSSSGFAREAAAAEARERVLFFDALAGAAF